MKAIRENEARADDDEERAELGYVRELLGIVNGTGRRISAVLQLTYEDLQLEKTNERPYGAIRWPSATDKTGSESVVPIGPRVRAALDRVLQERPGIGRAPIFPAPGDASEPMDRHLAHSWLTRAEDLAELEPQTGSAWHAYRRKWATERKHLPDVDVMEAGGWKSLAALKSAYQQPDEATMLEVVLGAGELREVNQ